jgi:TetR/AcrR family transcriptional regulator, transcriptional repressor for nem operon
MIEIIQSGRCMRYASTHKEQTRQRLLCEAAAAIRAAGPEQLGVASLMATLGLTHGGFYAHFRSKDELIAQAIGEMFAQRQAWFERKTMGLAPRAALGAYVDAYVSGAHCAAPERGCAMATLACDLPRLSGPARQAFTAGAGRLIDSVAALFAALGKDAGEAAALASSMMAEMMGAVALARALDDPARAEAVLRRSRDALKARLGLDEDGT